MWSVGIDASPVAAAATRAKLTSATPEEIVAEATRLLCLVDETEMPQGEFWELAYHRRTLGDICRIRAALLAGQGHPRIAAALTGILLGALHGPLRKTRTSSYLSNQCPRTYAPKPAYAVRFWSAHGMAAPETDLLSVVLERAERYYRTRQPSVGGAAVLGDSQDANSFLRLGDPKRKANWVITSPPYYGLTTYVPDQWLRNWFVGGPAEVAYTTKGQLPHNGLHTFEAGLKKVWINAAAHSAQGANLVVRFGAINDRRIDSPHAIVRRSLSGTPWRVVLARPAGTASTGRRQAESFGAAREAAAVEYDVWAKLDT